MKPDVPSLGSLLQVAQVFQSALRQVMEVTAAERSVILFGEGMEEPKVRAVSGFPSDNFWLTAPLSLTVLRNVCHTGEPVEVEDVSETPALQAELSLVLANVRSLVCAPIWSARGSVAGAIYVDWVGRASSARQRLLPRLQEVARKLETFLRKVEEGEANVSDPFEVLAARPASPRPQPAAVPISRRRRVFARPDGQSRSLFFRSLATMFGAGLPLVPSLYTLSKSSGCMGEISEEMARRLERGQSLSQAISELDVFPELVVSTLRVGERTGRLHLSLERLAQLEEDGQKRRSQMRSALVYPAFVLTGCALFLLLAPAAMLSAQVKMLSQLHVEMPWLSRLLLAGYGLLSKPWIALPLVLLLFWLGRSERFRSHSMRLCRRIKPVDRLLTSYEMAHWSQLMALQLESGLSAADGLAPDSLARSRLIEGEELWRALRADGYPRIVCEMVRSGEETGRVPEMLRWLSVHFRDDFADRLESSTRLLEPLVMAFLGVVAGFLVVATLLPMSRALQNL